jgi:hypothetical protein
MGVRVAVRILVTVLALSQLMALDPSALGRRIGDAVATALPASLGLGASVPLHPVTKHSGCRVRGPLPDAGCTPGTRYRLVDKQRVCTPGYAGSVRNVPRSRKDAVYRAYGIRNHFNGHNGEVDHLVSLELGGTNVTANLFPEVASPRPGSHEKDRLENRLHDEVCAGQITLRRAQRLIASNWVKAYRARFG